MAELQIIENTPAAINEFRDDAKATIGRNGDLIDTYLKDKYGDKIPNNIREAAYKKGVTINGKKVNLRSGLPTKYRIGNATHKIGKVTDWYRNELIAKATNKPNPSNITLPGIGPKTSGMFSTPGERKTTRSTGVYRGQFIVGKVLSQADQNATIDELKTWSSEQLNDLSYQIRMDDILERTSNDPNYEKEWEDVYTIGELVEKKEMEESK